MANSIGYLLSLNPYSTGAEATAEGVSQGGRVVYATTDTLSTSNLLYGDSRLTQPVFGLANNYYSFQLLTNKSVKYVITFSSTGAISFYIPTTTTTTTIIPFSDTIKYGNSGADACSGSPAFGTFSVTGNSATFCSSTQLTSIDFSFAPIGTGYISFGGQYYSVLTNGTSVATVTSSCSPCV